MAAYHPSEGLAAHTILLSLLTSSLDDEARDRLKKKLQEAIWELRYDPEAPQVPDVSNENLAKILEVFVNKLDHS